MFFDATDVDVVVDVAPPGDGASFEDACAEVARRTGWRSPSTSRADGRRLVVLEGEFEGVKVDAQVRRRDAPPTESERVTDAALAVNRSIRDGVDAERRACVALLHAWTQAAGVRGTSCAACRASR